MRAANAFKKMAWRVLRQAWREKGSGEKEGEGEGERGREGGREFLVAST